MEHITDTRIEQDRPTAVTLGNFDGLHLGHRSLINLTKQFAEEQGLKMGNGVLLSSSGETQELSAGLWRVDVAQM